MLMRCHRTSWEVYILKPFRLKMMPLMAVDEWVPQEDNMKRRTECS